MSIKVPAQLADEVLAKALKFENRWHTEVSNQWLYEQCGMVKGRKVRKDIRDLYDNKLWPELVKRWPDSQEFCEAEKRKNQKTKKKQRRKRKNSAPPCEAEVAETSPAAPHLGGSYGFRAYLEPSSSLRMEESIVEQHKGVWGLQPERLRPFVGSAGAGPAASSSAAVQICKCVVFDHDGVIRTTNRCNRVNRKKGCPDGINCNYCHVHPATKSEIRQRPSKGCWRDLLTY